MSEVAIRQDGPIEQKIAWAKAMAPAGLLPKAYQQNPANLFLAAELADSLGIDRINALTSIHVVEGKPSASADLMAALVRRAGHTLRVQVKEGAAKAMLIRADDPDFTFDAVWDLKRAQAAGLTGKAVWKSYPQAMLRSRAITEVIRMGASEVLVGVIYTPEELGAPVDSTGTPLEPAPVTAAVTVDELLGGPAPDGVVDVSASEVLDDEVVVEDEPDWPAPAA